MTRAFRLQADKDEGKPVVKKRRRADDEEDDEAGRYPINASAQSKLVCKH